MAYSNLSVDEIHLRLSPAIVRAYLKNDFKIFLEETKDIPDSTFICFIMISHFEAMENLLGLADNDDCSIYESVLLLNADAYSRCRPAVMRLTQHGIYARQLRLFIRKNRTKKIVIKDTDDAVKDTECIVKMPSLFDFIKYILFGDC